ncbi:hypothetical protein AB0O67_04190 [Streptomyces sp. NPDC086077]|uniref:hypothetical protein n=1 Tax=Streptomyces sp. NPDC086077 TaxID=3154862 RepID=UPI00343F196E
MTQSVPPQPTDGNPFAQQPVPVPPAPSAPARGNVALGVLAAVVAALVSAGVYGAVVGATEYEIGFAAIGVGFVVGFAAGKVGGANPVLPVLSAVLSLGAVYLGQLVGAAILAADLLGVSATEMFTGHMDLLMEAWQESADAMTFLFLAIGAFAAYSGAKKAAA